MLKFCILLGAFWRYKIDIKRPSGVELSQIEGKMSHVKKTDGVFRPGTRYRRLGWSAGGFGLMLRWGEVLVSTATPPTVRPQHLNIPKGQVLHTEDTLQEMQKHKTGIFTTQFIDI